jgi:hypothetical protein
MTVYDLYHRLESLIEQNPKNGEKTIRFQDCNEQLFSVLEDDEPFQTGKEIRMMVDRSGFAS